MRVFFFFLLQLEKACNIHAVDIGEWTALFSRVNSLCTISFFLSFFSVWEIWDCIISPHFAGKLNSFNMALTPSLPLPY